MLAVVGWGLAQRLFTGPEPNRPRPSARGLIVVFAPLALISLFRWRRQDDSDVWVTYFFWTFFLGMATWWALERSIRVSIFWGVVDAFQLRTPTTDWRGRSSYRRNTEGKAIRCIFGND